jgi:osmoprotectant transport system permease protein
VGAAGEEVGGVNVLDFISANAGELGRRTLEHLYLSGVSLLFALLVALPLALWLGHTGRGAFLAINSSNIGRALPSLGLIAIFVSLFGLNDIATILALVLLGIPPILTNAYTGIREVDRDVVEAARGMGLTEWQVLRQVEVPLAGPVILAGVRTSAVQIVATATLAAVVAGGGLGRFIVDGLSVQDYPQMLTGAIAVAVLTVLTEIALGVVERVTTPRGLTAGRDAGAPTVAPGPADSAVRPV